MDSHANAAFERYIKTDDEDLLYNDGLVVETDERSNHVKENCQEAPEGCAETRAVLSGEKYIMSKRELREECLKASDNGFEITLDYRGEHYCIADNTELDCYRMLLDVMDVIDEMAADGCVLDGCTIHNMPDGYLCMSHLDCE